jgi:hypothetical protein
MGAVKKMITKDEIIKAAQAMSQDERLDLIAEIAALVDENDSTFAMQKELSNDEVVRVAQTFIDNHKNLLRRLAE